MVNQRAQLEQLRKSLKNSDEYSKNWQPFDQISNLSQNRKAGWRRVLSSIATTEGYESLVLKPILLRFKNDHNKRAYLEQHSIDEYRHSDLLKRYLKNSFNYEKTSSTISDKIFYLIVIPIISKLFSHLPILGLSTLYFYELFATKLYGRLLHRAQLDQLPGLVDLIKQIMRDENRHTSGVEILMTDIVKNRESRILNFFEASLQIPLLALLRIDLSMSRYAIHNRELSRHFRLLTIKPIDISTMGKSAAIESRKYHFGLLGPKSSSAEKSIQKS